MENTAIIKEFSEYLRNVKNRSECTISAYCSDLAQFCLIMGVSEGFNGITQRDIEGRYISNLVASGMSPASRARKLASLKSFFKWAKSNNYVVENPVENVESPKIPHREPKVMSTQEVEEVMVAARCSDGNEGTTFRDIAIISLLFGSGLRRAEVVNAKLKDLNLNDGSLLVEGKGAKQRRVYFGDNTRSILCEYVLSHRRLMKTAAKSEYLFCSRQSEKISLCQINNIIAKHMNAAGLSDKKYTVHTTRRTFASQVYYNTRDLLVVQRLLGHQSSQTTLRYISETEEIKKQAALTVNF